MINNLRLIKGWLRWNGQVPWETQAIKACWGRNSIWAAAPAFKKSNLWLKPCHKANSRPRGLHWRVLPQARGTEEASVYLLPGSWSGGSPCPDRLPVPQVSAGGRWCWAETKNILRSRTSALGWDIHCCCSFAQSCPTLCGPMDCSSPGFPVHHQLPEPAQTMSTESVMPSNHLILCRPLLLPPSIFPSIRVFSNESVLCIRWPKYSALSLLPTNIQDWFPLGGTGWISLRFRGLSWCSWVVPSAQTGETSI